MFNKKIIFCLVGPIFLFVNLTYGQYRNITISQSVINKYYTNAVTIPNIVGMKNITNYLPKGFKTDGSVDYTPFLQKGINENKIVVMPNFPVLINNKGLKIPSNRKIYFQRNSKVIFSGPALGKFYDIIILDGVSNVGLYNANIVGSRNIPKKQHGEWSSGISIKDSYNITIKNAKISDTFGDGIFIGSETGRKSSNILIQNVWINKARRNGVSITSVSGLNLENILVTNTNGTSPETGIHIEPSLPSEVLKSISINGILSYNNKNGGFGINLSLLNGAPNTKSNLVDISASNFKDYGSTNFIGFTFNPEGKSNAVVGKVNLRNFEGNGTKKYKVWYDPNHSNVSITSDEIFSNDSKGNRIKIDLTKKRTQ
ncbi:right-handed parallel beta-helix repeat-containing protein [Sphingobacterium sp. PU5-4]|uniref:Right-handed parallel beta-helix repeat-containing protein n=1 Tax=Sphingobacterium tenebrionis TaxID=3111775 RepID=A0ABU8I2I2_9SPHI